MKRKILALVTALVLLLAAVLPVGAANYGEGTQTVHVHKIVKNLEVFFIGHEGNYDSVVLNDNGAVSLGKLGWHGPRALYLLKAVIEKNKEQALAILGSALYNEIVSAQDTAWNERVLSAAEGAAVSKLLGTAEGRAAQDELAYADISTYVGYAWKAGIRTDAAIFYYCTVENQYGHGGATKFMRYVRQTLGISENEPINSLETLHDAVLRTDLPYIQNYIGYRKSTYNYIVKLGWDTVGGGVNCPGGVFHDMPAQNHWAHEGIDYAVSHGLFYGTSETEFQPNTEMTRAMVVTVLYRMAGKPQAASETAFADVAENTWYTDAVKWAAAAGVTTGFEDGSFRPEQYVTREQLVTFLHRYTAWKGGAVTGGSLAGFADAEAVSAFAREAMGWAISRGYVYGTGGAGAMTLEPQGGASRAQVATILMRYCMGD